MVAETSHGSAFLHIPCAVSSRVILKHPLQHFAEYRRVIFNSGHGPSDVSIWGYYIGSQFFVFTLLFLKLFSMPLPGFTVSTDSCLC